MADPAWSGVGPGGPAGSAAAPGGPAGPPPADLRGETSGKLRTYLALTAVGTIAGLALGRPELVAAVAPLAVYVALGLAEPQPVVVLSPPRVSERVIEGGEVEVTIRVRTDVGAGRLDLELRPHPWLAGRTRAVFRPLQRWIPPQSAIHASVPLRAGRSEEVRFRLRAARWGAPPAGVLSGHLRGRFGLIDQRLAPRRLSPVRVYPRTETLRRMVDPRELQATVGSRVTRTGGEGIEFAEVRPFAAGDAVRRINWRVTARRDTPYVSERHPERNADVIIFLDTFAEVGEGRESTMVLAVRAAATLAGAYLERKDRVGLLGFGGVLTGVGPRLGDVQVHRIADALLRSEVTLSYVGKDVSLVPRRLLPAKALVIAITPLIDERSLTALVDLRRRRFDLVVLDISPMPFSPPGPGAAMALAHRLWLLRREAIKTQFRRMGVAVCEWDGREPLQPPVAVMAATRRRAQRAGVR